LKDDFVKECVTSGIRDFFYHYYQKLLFMKIIIPMAGKGSRLRPHTLTVPKPLICVAGKPIVQRLVEDLAASYNGKIDEVAFITGDFGAQVEAELISIANGINAKGVIYKQDTPLGIAHAIGCAAPSLSGNLIVAFADTLFRANFHFNPNEEGIIWTQKVEDPSSFGVVKIDMENVITDFVEKPQHFVSNLAIVGIYYFRDGDLLRQEIDYLVENDIKLRGEYQLTSVLENMKSKHNVRFRTAQINEWIDCGNKDAVIHANERILEIKQHEKLLSNSAFITNSVIIPPCFIGENAIITDSVIGPYVSVGNKTTIKESVIMKSVIGDETVIKDATMFNSMIGNFVEYKGNKSELSISDYSKYAS
jgi:glucose-1-phosphate thymidylyltransferase